MSMLRELLLANKAPVVIATVHDIGYALCEIAENPRHTSNNGVSRLAQTVRHWRIAAGLTQTAVAKQSGVNRSYLSHLESGRRNPTLATLQRLAKILNVAPGYFLCRAAGSDGASLRPALDALSDSAMRRATETSMGSAPRAAALRSLATTRHDALSPQYAGKCCSISSRTSASVRSCITSGMTSGRGSGRDQFGLGRGHSYATQTPPGATFSTAAAGARRCAARVPEADGPTVFDRA